MRKSVLLAAALLGVVACRPKPALTVTAAPPAVLPAGFSLVSSKDGAVSLGVPSGWRHGVDKISMGGVLGSTDTTSSDPSLNADLSAIVREAESDATAREQVQLDALFKKGILLHVINESRPVFDETRTRFVVQRYTAEDNWDYSSALEQERHQYAFQPNRTEIGLPIGKVFKLQASETLRNGSNIHRISYLAIHGKSLYVLRFLTEESAQTIQSIADDVAKSWRIQAPK